MLEVTNIIFLYVVPSLICLMLVGFILKIIYQRMTSKKKIQKK